MYCLFLFQKQSVQIEALAQGPLGLLSHTPESESVFLIVPQMGKSDTAQQPKDRNILKNNDNIVNTIDES